MDLRYSRVTSSGVRELTAKLPKADFLILDRATASRGARRPRPPWPTQRRGRDRRMAARDRRQSGDDRRASDRGLAERDVDYGPELTILTRVPQLNNLSLQHTEISAIGLEQCAASRSLERLDLGHTLLGDAALAVAHLADEPAGAGDGEHAHRWIGARRIAPLTNLRESISGAPDYGRRNGATRHAHAASRR